MASINPLSAQAASYDAATHEVVVTASDFDGIAVNTAKTVTFVTDTSATGAEGSIEFLSWEVVRPFTGGSVVTTTVSFGNGNAAADFGAAKQISDAHASNIVRWNTPAKKASDGTLTATFSAPGAGKYLSEYTDGEIRARFRIINAAASVNAG